MNQIMKAFRSFRRVMLMPLLILLSGVALSADPTEATITSPSGPIMIATNQIVGFLAASADSFGYDIYTVNSYSWSFGDGTTGAGASTSHVYAVAGTYSVTLTVSYSGKTCTRMDTNGNCTSYQTTTKTATASRVLTALAPPAIGSFSAS